MFILKTDGSDRLTAMQNKVLITQGMRPFAQRVAKLLPVTYTLLFGSAEDVPNILIDNGNFVRIPHANTPIFIHEVIKKCLDREISVVIPLGVEELYPLAKGRPLFSEYGIEIWVPDVNVLANLSVVENPPKQLTLIVLAEGRSIPDGNADKRFEGLSGVFTPSDSDDELALCCIAD